MAALEFRGTHQTFLDDDAPEIDLEGARNSGKTWVVCAKVIRSCHKYPGIEWLISRYSGEETKNKLRPEFVKVCALLGEVPTWDADESCYEWENGSKVFAYGLRTQNLRQFYAKIRGLGVAGVWVDQTEELPEPIGTELRFATRQSGFPHQLIFSPNPPPEDHYLCDQFPEDNLLPGRHYYRVSIYDNAHNLPEQTILQVEQAYPPSHPRHKSLVLGMRGPSVTGTPIYEHAFVPALHVGPLVFDADQGELLEAIHAGQHHPVWLAAQRNYFGGIELLGGVMGKRLFLEDFLPVIERYRHEWFGAARAVKTCIDPPLTSQMRFTTARLLRMAGLRPRWQDNATAPDVREAVIETIGSYMHKRLGATQAFVINSDSTRWLMASYKVVKQSKFFLDGCQANYVWDENLVSVGHKKHRQPKPDEWTDGAQRCLENLVLNFCADQLSRSTQQQREQKTRQQSQESGASGRSAHSASWLGQ